MPKKDMESGDSSAARNAGSPVRTEQAALEILRSRSDLSYQYFDGVELKNAVARQSLFHGALFRNCTISDCDFSRSDFEGTRFENCTLKNVSFETADIRSTKFAKSKLGDCTFRSTVCSDNLFINTIIEHCDFEDSSVLHSTLKNCIIRQLKNRTAAWLHTTFNRCRLAEFAFTDCTSSYTIYDRCEFESVVVNADSFGLTFGITERNLKSLKFGFLGQTYDEGVAPSIDSFLEQYEQRNWRIHALILALNFKPDDSQKILFSLLKELGTQIGAGSGAKKDDLEFVFRVMSLLRSQQRLPFITAIFAHDLFAEIDVEEEEQQLEKRFVEMGQQYSLHLSKSMYEDLLKALAPIIPFDHSEAVDVKIVYPIRPGVPTLDYVGNAAAIAQSDTKNTILLESKEGSWIEVIQIGLGSLFAFYVALFLVNGCLAQLTMVRARSKKLVAKRLPPKFIQAASDPSHDLPKVYKDILQKLVASQLSMDQMPAKPIATVSQKEVEGLLIEVNEVKL